MTFGEVILSIVGFLTHPTWHLVVFYIILLAIIAYSIVGSWFADFFKWGK